MLIRVLSKSNIKEVQARFRALHVDEVGIGLMQDKTQHHLLHIQSLNVPAANILKQEMLSIGGDVALDKRSCNYSISETPCILIGTYQQFLRLIRKLSAQPFGLKKVGKEIKLVLERFLGVPPPIKMGRFTLDFSKRPLIMAILNVTPDSFSGDGIYKQINKALKKVESFMEEGADILDIGGESTRPGATSISLKEELTRVIPMMKAIAKRVKIPISIDTSKADVARQSLSLGASIINDVSGLLGDPKMSEVAAAFEAPVVVMHHQKMTGKSLLDGVSSFFQERLSSLEKMGIRRDKVILDPGIGFGKSPEQNLVILKRLCELKSFGRPLLVGVSRKSFLGRLLDREVKDRRIGSVASVVSAYENGGDIFRVHDVCETRDALKVAQAIRESCDG